VVRFGRFHAEHSEVYPVKRGKRGPAPKIQQQLEQLSALPKAKQRFVSEMIDNVLAQASR